MADDYKVPYTTILAIGPHSNADRLEVATVYGFQVIVSKDRYKVGDKVIYVPIDSILDPKLEDKLFVPRYDASGKRVDIYLHHHRVRQIRIRKVASQGMLISPTDIAEFINMKYVNLEDDLSAILKITKYEPPVVGPAQTIGVKKNRNKKSDNPLFHKYNGLNNIKWFPELFKEGEEVVIQEKLHGTNARASILPYAANTLWKKVKKFFGLAPKYENCYGSNNVEISANSSYKGFYGEDVYGKCFAAADIFNKILPGETVFGEIIGPGIQKNYSYGLTEHKFVVFDVKILDQVTGRQYWLSPDAVEAYTSLRGLEYVPVAYKGPFNKEFTYTLTKGKSLYDAKTKVREGVVIKSKDSYSIEGNKKALKWVSEEYLDDTSNTDNH